MRHGPGVLRMGAKMQAVILPYSYGYWFIEMEATIASAYLRLPSDVECTPFRGGSWI